MAELAEIVARLRSQKIEVAGLAADAIESLVASEAEARAALAEMREESVRLLAQLNDYRAQTQDAEARQSAGVV